MPSAAGAGDGGSGGPGSASTPEERRAAVAKRLDDSLGTFDQTIRKEQERVAKERDAHAAAGAGQGGTSKDDAGAGSAQLEGPRGHNGDLKSDKASAGKPGDGKKSGDAGNSSGSAGPVTGGTGATAKGLPDGSDDDIVARRLRRAAEQETDPELKEKLWKEYIEYKKNAGK